MINFYEIASIARQMDDKKQKSLRPSDANNPRAYAALHQPFNHRLLDACVRVKDHPDAIPESLFIAFPERLLGKARYIHTDTREAKDSDSGFAMNLSAPVLDLLRQYDDLNKDCRFANLSAKDDAFPSINKILVCHGLSPIGDSIALLADIGRAYRASWVTGLPMRVMLADISWMSSNRSIRQFDLKPEDIDTGLRVCLDKRQRLYKALGMSVDIHEIIPYEKKIK